ncbi:MAG: hypothetical protein WAM60_23795 [Candidatus Promineifilaceae bacterium]
MVGGLLFGVVATLGPALSTPVGEGESRLAAILASTGPFLICFVPSMVPFLLIGGWVVIRALNPVVAKTRIERPEVLISNNTLRVGESFRVTYRQAFKFATDVDKALIQFVLRETATYQRGTDTYTVYHNHVHFERSYPSKHYESGQLFEDSLELKIPLDGMHTFMATRNKLQWFVHVEVKLAKWPDYKEDFEVQVLPEMVAEWTK